MRSPARLGFIGLGNIGGAVCTNLLADGHAVTVFDLDRGRVQAMVARGAEPARAPAEVGAASDVTFLSLPTPATVQRVALGWLEAAQGSGKLLVDLSTNAPSTVRELGARLASAGARLVEAPVTGGAAGARQRRLVFILGGEPRDVADVEPILATVGRATFHLGPLGTGNVGKLVNSLVALTDMWAAIEGMALAARNGIELRRLVEMIRSSGAGASYLDRRVEDMDHRNRPTEFAIELAAKDAALMVEVGHEAQVPVPAAAALHQVLVLALAQGLGGHDIGDLAEVAERAASLSLRLGPA